MTRHIWSTRVAGVCIAVILVGGLISLFDGLALAADGSEKSPLNGTLMRPCSTMSVGGADGWEPISYIDADGRQVGVAIDILRRYSAQTGTHLSLQLEIPWTRALQMLEQGELDVIAGAYFTTERDKMFHYSTAFASDDIMVFQRHDNLFDVEELQDLIGYTGARPQGGSYGDKLDRYAQDNLDMIFSPTGNKIFNILLNGRVDYVMLGRYDGLSNLYRDKLTDKIKAVEPPLVRNEVLFLFSRSSPCVRDIANINLLIEALDEDGTLELWTQNHIILNAESGS